MVHISMKPIVIILTMVSVFALPLETAADCPYLVDFPSACAGKSCNRAPYMPVYAEQWCEPWVGNLYGYPFIKYAAYERQYDCEGDSCVCQPHCFPIDMCAYDTMAECQKNHNGMQIVCADEYYSSCAPTADSFPAPDCPPDVCCIGGGGPGGGGPGGGGENGGRFSLNLVQLAPHSLAPRFEIHYNNKLRLDRSVGYGWSHSYLITLAENPASGTVTIRGETGFGWVYRSLGDGNYQSAPYDRSVLNKQGSEFVSTLKDGTRYIFNTNGKLLRITDPANNMLTMTYAADGQLQKVADSYGRELQFIYEANHLKAIVDPNGNQFSFSYEQENLSAVIYPDGSKKRFIYSDLEAPHNLMRVIDDNNNILAIYEYDHLGRIIKKGNSGGSGSVEINYAPAQELFADDFQNGISPQWSAVTGTVNVAGDPDPLNSGNSAVRLHPGSMRLTNPAGGVTVLKISFDLWVASATNQDFWVKVFDNSRDNDEYGVTLKFTKERNLYSELVHGEENLGEFIRSGVTADAWHRVEIEADTTLDHGYQYFNIWLDCEYAGKYLFKRPANRLDSVIIQAPAPVSDVFVDNIAVEEVINDTRMVVTTDSRGGRETLIIEQGNEFGGESWRIERTGKTGGGCSSCGAAATRYDFDEQWNIRRTIDANGLITAMTYDERGNMLTKTEAAGTPLERTTTYTYHEIFNEITTLIEPSVDTPSRHKVKTYQYDAAGNLVSETVQGYSRGQSVSYITTHQYNERGQRTQTDGPRADVDDVSITVYDLVKGYLVSTTNAAGAVIYADYDANHNVGSVTDGNGNVTRYTYDYANRIKTVSTNSGITTYLYDAHGNVSTVTMPEGNQISYSYNQANRLIRITDTLGNYITYTYDDVGNKTREEVFDAQGILKKYLDFEYDHFNRLNKIKNPDNSFSAFTYDGNGNRTVMESVPAQVVTIYVYDELNRLTKVMQAYGTSTEAVTEYQYDAHDNLTMVKDAEGKSTTYRYDDLGRLLEIHSPDTGITVYTYDESGNVKSKTDAKGVTVSYDYDALSRVTGIDFPDEPDIEYRYDETTALNGRGRLTTVTDASGTTRYDYDGQGNVIEQRTTIGNTTYVTRYEYNRNNALTKVTYPHGAVVEYQRDTSGNISSVFLDKEPIADGFGYEPFGEFNAMNFPEAHIQTSVSRDQKYQVKSIQAGTIVNRVYGYDFNNNISFITQLDTLPRPVLFSGMERYSYATGKDQITAINNDGGITPYSYDANGNIISDGVYTYWYNVNNQLIKVTNGAVRAEYVYNAKGQRVKKVAGENTTIYHYDLDGNLIVETTASGSLIAGYVYAGSTRLAMIDGSDNIFYYHNDHLGTPLAMTDRNGTVVWRAAYDPFGAAQVDERSRVTNNFRFPGQYYDEESGLHYNWHRYYDPRTGRYMTADPIGLDAGLNLFSYSDGNPLKYTDRLGLDNIGCDGIPDFLETACRLECCAEHDECYDKNKCTSNSWKSDCSVECDLCNYNVKECFKKCLFTNNDNPQKPNYYCAKLHGYVKIPGDFPSYKVAKKFCKTS